MLRLIFVFGIIFVGGYYSFQGPFYALLFYLWNAYFRPEFWIWDDVLLSLRLSLAIGALLVLSSIQALQRLQWSRTLILVVCFLAQTTLSYLTSEYSARLTDFWIEFAKVIVITILITVLVDDERKLRLTVLVMAFSLGFEAAKQGWAQFVMNPGAANTNEHIMLGDNNGVALGMLMLVPLFMALAETSRNWREKGIINFFVAGVFYRAISTYSRGGFLAAGVVGLVSLWRAKYPIRMLLTLGVLAYAVSAVMPQSFWDRMSSIAAPADQQDESAQGRLYYWELGTQMANDHPVTGVGLNSFRYAFDRYDRMAGGPGGTRAVHSVWFGCLSELGYPGLFLFVGVLASAVWSTERVRRLAKKSNSQLGIYAAHLQTTFAVFAVGGTFLNAQYLELFWHFVGLSIALERIAATAATSTGETARPAQVERPRVSTMPRYIPKTAGTTQPR